MYHNVNDFLYQLARFYTNRCNIPDTFISFDEVIDGTQYGTFELNAFYKNDFDYDVFVIIYNEVDEYIRVYDRVDNLISSFPFNTHPKEFFQTMLNIIAQKR